MGATLNFYVFPSGYSTAAADGRELKTASCLSFGGGTRSDFQNNIAINTWNTALHLANSNTETDTDMCPSPHLWPITYNAASETWGVSTGCLLEGTYINMAVDTPHYSHGVNIRFRYDYGVKVNPVRIWAGSGADVSGSPQNAIIKIADLTSSLPCWKSASASGKLDLKPHGTSVAEHYWSAAISVKPIAVGFKGDNKIKVELTYY